MNALLLLWCGLAAPAVQDQAPDLPALFRRCDSEIPWISDGAQLVDNEWKRRLLRYEHDRDPFFEEAKRRATERKRLILWYCVRVPGAHMIRAYALDQYVKVALLTDPGVVDLIRTKFVPIRACCDENLSASTGIRRFEFIEPGFVILTPEGKIVQTISPIRTFNPDWFRGALIAVLQKNEAYNAPAGESAEDLIRGGDDEQALAKASPEQKALILRRAGRLEDVLRMEGVPFQRALATLNAGKIEEARALLEKESSPEALYYRAVADSFSGRDPAPLLRELTARHPETPWAWRAAAELVRGSDGMPEGPLSYHLLDCFTTDAPGAATSTRRPGREVDRVARRAVEFLLRAQRQNGSWDDNRYTAWPDAKNVRHVAVVATALASLALLEWRAIDPARIDEALRRADRFLIEEKDFSRQSGCYADAYRLLYFARTGDAPHMREMIALLAGQQDREGYWGHDYPNPFTTAIVIHSLTQARKAGAEVPEPMLRRAADAIRGGRGAGASFAYNSDRAAHLVPSSEKDSMSRKALCELGLLEAGTGDREQIRLGLDSYWKHLSRLEAVRTCDFHADGELAGFTFFHAVFHTSEAAAALDEPDRTAQLRRFTSQILSIPEFDGTFVDSHELGKSYGTALALLVLARAR